jgi:hypothetical protein
MIESNIDLNPYELWIIKHNKVSKRLIRHHFNKNKIKASYSTKQTIDNNGRERYVNYICYYFRRVTTLNELKKTVGHFNEYGDSITRGKRSPSNIPDSWDDYTINVWKQQKSWKHNSKRKRQWKP